jgi:hypothetical protein
MQAREADLLERQIDGETGHRAQVEEQAVAAVEQLMRDQVFLELVENPRA